MAFVNKLDSSRVKVKIFARWHLAIAITSIFSFCVINSGANVDMGSYAPD